MASNNNIVKYTFMWVIILLCVNFIALGYSVSEGVNPRLLVSGYEGVLQLYNLGFDDPSSSLTSLTNDLTTINNSVGPDDIVPTDKGGVAGVILDTVDSLLNFGLFLGFLVTFITLGSLINGFVLWSQLSGINPFVAWFVLIFLAFANIIYLIWIAVLIFKKGNT